MFQTYVEVDPWDLVDEGIDTVLDRLRGEAGASGVSVTMAGPAVAVLRPHKGVSPRTFRSEGGLQFQPSREAYAATRLRPTTAGWLKKSNPLTAIAEGCAARGLALRGRLYCCHSELLASKFDFASVKDVWGDAHPGWLCPNNPDVRAFFHALVVDAASVGALESLEIAALGFAPPSLWRCARSLPADVGPAGEWLLSICFCESCRQAAGMEGIDSWATARSVSVTLDRALAVGEPVAGSIADLMESDPIVAAYARFAERQVSRLVNMLGQACPCRLIAEASPAALRAIGASPGRTGHVAASGDAPAAARIAGIVTPATLGDVQPVLAAAIAEIGDTSRLDLRTSADPASCPDSAALVRAFSIATGLGIRTASITHYGLLPQDRLGWIKQATRYAQRESE